MTPAAAADRPCQNTTERARLNLKGKTVIYTTTPSFLISRATPNTIFITFSFRFFGELSSKFWRFREVRSECSPADADAAAEHQWWPPPSPFLASRPPWPSPTPPPVRTSSSGPPPAGSRLRSRKPRPLRILQVLGERYSRWLIGMCFGVLWLECSL